MFPCPHECSAACHDAVAVRAHIAGMLREWRATEQRSLDSLASLIGVSRSAINLWERGRRIPSLENLICLAQIMNTPLCHFFCPESRAVPSQTAIKSNKYTR